MSSLVFESEMRKRLIFWKRKHFNKRSLKRKRTQKRMNLGRAGSGSNFKKRFASSEN